MKTSIVIPNFNGRELLKKNLPNILNTGADEILIIDDGSKDGSVPLLRETFPLVKLLINKQNLGFIPSVNRLFQEARGDVVVLLNNDVLVEKHFLKFLVRHFEDKSTFAVNCHEKGEGPSRLTWKEGFIEFTRGSEVDKLQKSAWASGGSAAYSKKVWQNLGGFDSVFAPFYWEDLDISFRAIKSGFHILWEPQAKVHHEHETTINKAFSKRYVDLVKQRNQLLFIWKNITDQNLLKDHGKNLRKRLFGGMGLGYWIPYLWALLKKPQIKKEILEGKLSDQEVINYVRN